jgi:hypothetical protein
MSTELALASEIGAMAKYDESIFKSLTTSTGFLPYLQLMSGASEIVKEGKFPIGHFALVEGKDLFDLGDTFVCLPLTWRPKAMQFQPEVLAYYDPESEGFKKLQEHADTMVSSGCGYGPEFLLWIPSVGKYATLFCANTTMRREAPNLLSHMLRTCSIKSKLIKTKKHTWHGPSIETVDVEIDLPDSEEARAKIDSFNNPPEQTVEIDDSSDSRER